MTFELAMRQFFGSKASHIADLAEGEGIQSRNKWLRKALQQMLKDVDALDTSPPHKQMLMSELEEIDKELKGCKNPSWRLVFLFFSLCSRFLGYDLREGGRFYTPVYHQSYDQFYKRQWLTGNIAVDSRKEKKDAISVRRRLVQSLKDEGWDTFHIGLIMNIAEHQVKQLLQVDL